MPTTIELTPQAEQVLNDLQSAPQWMVEAIGQAMVEANQHVIARATEFHLTGRGPFPPAEHRLGVRSNILRMSVRDSIAQSKATASGSQVSTTIGSPVVYAAIHEFGGTIKVKPHKGKVRLATDRYGRLLRQNVNAHLAVFARNTRKVWVKEVEFESEGHEINMPARAPITTAVEESLEEYGQRVSAAVVAAWRARQ